MKYRMYLAACALLILAIRQMCCAQAYKPQPFSADMVTVGSDGTKMAGKYYFSPPNYRFDMNVGGYMLSSIKNGNTMYTVMHYRHTYMKLSPEKTKSFMRQTPWVSGDVDRNNPCVWAKQRGASCKKLGTETVNGRVCDKYQGFSSDGKVTGSIWVDEKLQVPIKELLSDGKFLDLTNVREGKPDASLFQPPAGYQRVPYR